MSSFCPKVASGHARFPLWASFYSTVALTARGSIKPARLFHNTTKWANDTVAQAGTPTREQTQSSQPELSNAPKRRRYLRPWIYAFSFFVVGLAGGQFVRAVIFPPPLPEPESPEDEFLLAKIRKDLDSLPIVQELRKNREEWLEYEAYMAMSPEAMQTSMTAGILQGSRALGVQRVFFNKKEKRLISVLFFGGALSGWPGVTHGGIISTVLQENLERVANGPDFGQSSSDSLKLDNLNVNYKKPTAANNLYIIRAEVDESKDEPPVGMKRVYVKAALENALAGYVCADATGLCTPNGSAFGSVHTESTSLWSSAKSTIGSIFG